MDISFFDGYLKNLSIPAEDKRYSSLFFRKMQYLKKLNGIASSRICGTVHSGYGNCNSKIMVIIDYYDDKKDAVSFLENVLSHINISIWNCWITFSRKTENESMNSSMLDLETKCIMPEAKINITRQHDTFISGKDIFISADDIKYIMSGIKDERYTAFMKKVYSYIPLLIPLKEIEVKE